MDGIRADKITDTLTVYQKNTVFSFGTDAVLLAAYTRLFVKRLSKKIGIDLCSGTGIIPLLLLDSAADLTFHAMDINEEAVALSKMSAQTSNLSHRFFPICDNLTRVSGHYAAESMDFLTCNPPYLTAYCGKMCKDNRMTAARHEIHCTLGDIFKSAFYLLRTGGNAYFLYRPERLAALFSAARANRFEIKNMTFVHPSPASAPILVLCEAKKDAAEGLLLSKPFLIHDENKALSGQMKKTTESGIMRL